MEDIFLRSSDDVVDSPHFNAVNGVHGDAFVKHLIGDRQALVHSTTLARCPRGSLAARSGPWVAAESRSGIPDWSRMWAVDSLPRTGKGSLHEDRDCCSDAGRRRAPRRLRRLQFADVGNHHLRVGARVECFHDVVDYLFNGGHLVRQL